MPNIVKIPREQAAGQSAWDGEITEPILELIIGGLLVPNQAMSKTLARQVRLLRTELQKVKAVLTGINAINSTRQDNKHEDNTDLRVVRPVDRSLLGQEQADLVPLPITDDRDFDYLDPRLREEADLIIHVKPTREAKNG